MNDFRITITAQGYKNKSETNKAKRRNLENMRIIVYIVSWSIWILLGMEKKNYSVSITDTDIIDKMEFSDFVLSSKKKKRQKMKIY